MKGDKMTIKEDAVGLIVAAIFIAALFFRLGYVNGRDSAHIDAQDAFGACMDAHERIGGYK